MRTVLVHGLHSNFNSIFEVLKTGRDFQYRSNSHISLNPSFWLRSWIRLCSSGSSWLSPSGSRGAPRGEHLSIRVRSCLDQLHGPIRFPQHLFSVHDHGRQRSGGGPQHAFLPYVGLTVHRAVSVRRVRPAGDPVDSDPEAVFEDDPHPRSDAGRPLEPLSVSPHSGADGLVQAELPPTSPEY